MFYVIAAFLAGIYLAYAREKKMRKKREERIARMSRILEERPLFLEAGPLPFEPQSPRGNVIRLADYRRAPRADHPSARRFS